jgi:DNA-binding protein HU-beta
LKKSDLIIKFSEKNNITVKDAERVLEIVINEITAALSKGNRAEFRGFGVFKPSVRSARKARNPKTGEIIKVPNTIIPTFRMAKKFFEKLNR